MLLIKKEKSSVRCKKLRFIRMDGGLSAIGGYQNRNRGLPWPPGSGHTRYRPSAEKGMRHELHSPQKTGARMSITQISLPKGVGPHAEKLFDAITQASTAEELNRAGGKAEGFVLGLESAKAIKSQIAESMYVAYDDAATQRASELA
jgi:hypothetical protein